jgi:hypothetical protein
MYERWPHSALTTGGMQPSLILRKRPNTCSIGAGSILLAQSALTADVRLGRHVVVMPMPHSPTTTGSAIMRRSARESLGGAVEVGPAAYLGMNATYAKTSMSAPSCPRHGCRPQPFASG